MSRSKIKAIFLDRDGIINKDFGYVYKIEDFEFMGDIFESCRSFKEKGYEIVIVTNQSGISRNYFTVNDFVNLNQWMMQKFSNENIDILDVLYCPHSPESNCSCRKPKPGMFLSAFEKYNIDNSLSWMIGDKETDIIAANNAGIYNTILIGDNLKKNDKTTKAQFTLKSLKQCIEIINF